MRELRAPGDVAREVTQQLAETARRTALLGIGPQVRRDLRAAARPSLAGREVARDVAVPDAHDRAAFHAAQPRKERLSAFLV